MWAMSDAHPYRREESEAERLDRNFGEQLQELRIAQAGVQILFAFLLTIPFQQRFTSLTDLQRDIYVVTLLSMAISTLVFMTPVAMHRMLFREGLKDFVVRHTDTAHRDRALLPRRRHHRRRRARARRPAVAHDRLLDRRRLALLALALWVLPLSQRRRGRRGRRRRPARGTSGAEPSRARADPARGPFGASSGGAASASRPRRPAAPPRSAPTRKDPDGSVSGVLLSSGGGGGI